MTRSYGGLIVYIFAGAFAALVVAFLLLTLWAIIYSYIWTPNITLSEAARDSVSGFYGPGSHAAWLVLLAANSEMTAIPKLLLSLASSNSDVTEDAFDAIGGTIDVNVIGVAAYYLTSFVDFKLKCFASARLETIDAQMAVAHMARAASGHAVWMHLLRILYLDRPSARPGSEAGEDDHSVYIPDKMPKRLLVWSLIMLGAESQMLSAYDSNSWQVSKLPARLHAWLASFFLMMCMLSNIAKPYGSTGRGVWILLTFVAVVGGPWVLSAGPTPDVGDSAAILGQRLAFPRTSASLKDLDQAAAVAIGLASVALPMYDGCRSLYERLLPQTLDEEADKPLGPPPPA